MPLGLSNLIMFAHFCVRFTSICFHIFFKPLFFQKEKMPWLIPMAARSSAWVCVRWLAGIAGSNPANSIDVFLL
jgi:hypothetical protein